MKNVSEVERRSNVIPLSFSDRRTKQIEGISNDIPNDIAHPASKRYPIDDPLDELLNEFNHLVDEDLINELDEYSAEKEDFIFHHQQNWDYQVEVEDDMRFMADTILTQIKRLKEDSKRLKYYLNEMNID
jgi:hypothetical protein